MEGIQVWRAFGTVAQRSSGRPESVAPSGEPVYGKPSISTIAIALASQSVPDTKGSCLATLSDKVKSISLFSLESTSALPYYFPAARIAPRSAPTNQERITTMTAHPPPLRPSQILGSCPVINGVRYSDIRQLTPEQRDTCHRHGVRVYTHPAINGCYSGDAATFRAFVRATIKATTSNT